MEPSRLTPDPLQWCRQAASYSGGGATRRSEENAPRQPERTSNQLCIQGGSCQMCSVSLVHICRCFRTTLLLPHIYRGESGCTRQWTAGPLKLHNTQGFMAHRERPGASMMIMRTKRCELSRSRKIARTRLRAERIGKPRGYINACAQADSLSAPP
jgi:hypothetical protein